MALISDRLGQTNSVCSVGPICIRRMAEPSFYISHSTIVGKYRCSKLSPPRARLWVWAGWFVEGNREGHQPAPREKLCTFFFGGTKNLLGGARMQLDGRDRGAGLSVPQLALQRVTALKPDDSAAKV